MTFPPHDEFATLLEQLSARLAQILPVQAPLADFVHRNPLHGFQHLPFPEAVKQAQELTGAGGYLSAQQFRRYYATGRISRDDLDTVLAAEKQLEAKAVVLRTAEQAVTRGDVYRIALVADLEPVTPHQFVWQLEEVHALEKVQPDVHIDARETLLNNGAEQGFDSEAATVRHLWQACVQVLKLDQQLLQPEAISLTVLSNKDTTGKNIAAGSVGDDRTEAVQQAAQQQLAAVCAEVGKKITLRQLLKNLTPVDIMEDIQPVLVPHLSAWLELQQAGWPVVAGAEQQGFYAYWRALAEHDLSSRLQGLPDWREYLESLPDDPVATLHTELQRMGIPCHDQIGYLERLALELPGWTAMFVWRAQHPCHTAAERPVALADYLAVRLVLEHLYARRLCRRHWLIEAGLPEIRGHFRRHPAEFLVRYTTCRGQLPEALLVEARQLFARSEAGADEVDWQPLAALIERRRHAPDNSPAGWQACNQGWRLFRLAQHLGLGVDAIAQLKPEQLTALFACLGQLDEAQSGYIWQQAYERNYREDLFRGLKANHNRGCWPQRGANSGLPEAQLIFCMDAREEGFRRHLEEINPQLETLGAMAFVTASDAEFEQQDGDAAEAALLAAFFHRHGLTEGFAPLLILVGHASSGRNNPYQAACQCATDTSGVAGVGGCGWDDARLMAVLLNDPVVREHLPQHGIAWPENVWVIAVGHDTASEAIRWFDTELIPQTLLPAFEKIRSELEQAAEQSAHERCRKLVSAPRQLTPQAARKYVAARARDGSQLRPELGHATNATAFVGRRFMSQGAFWDRRAFLVSYDCRTDADNHLLEDLLLRMVPVVAGINLACYFAGVSHECYGSGSAVIHNPVSGLGVMSGTGGDLRTGLPQQMVEMHEPMRLLLVLESDIDRVTEIYTRQPQLHDWMGNQWLQVAVKNPETADIHLFRPDKGFELWEGSGARFMPEVSDSADWYQGHYDHLAPALIGTGNRDNPTTEDPGNGNV